MQCCRDKSAQMEIVASFVCVCLFLINRLDSIVNVLFLCGEINACAIKCVLFGKNVNFSSAEWAMSEALLKAAQERCNPLRKQASCWSWVSAAHSGAFCT